MKPIRFSLLSFAALTMAASMAYADECVTDADCAPGFACEEMSWGSCPAMPPCEEGAECPEPPPCEEGSEFVCVVSPEECDTDADCGEGLSCVTFTSETCSGGTAPPVPSEDPGGAEGEPTPDAEGEDFSCTTESESYCAPAYVGPCVESADCGEGFTCVEIEECSCSAGGAPPSPDGGEGHSGGSEGGEVPDGDCTCSGSGTFYCEPIEVECETNADCPSTWTCEDLETPDVVCAGAPGEETECDDVPVEAELRCFPPSWDAWGGSHGGNFEDDGPAVQPEIGEGGGEGTGSSQDDGSPAPATPNAAGPQDESGCSTARGDAAGGGVFALMLAGLALVRRRR